MGPGGKKLVARSGQKFKTLQSHTKRGGQRNSLYAYNESTLQKRCSSSLETHCLQDVQAEC